MHRLNIPRAPYIAPRQMPWIERIFVLSKSPAENFFCGRFLPILGVLSSLYSHYTLRLFDFGIKPIVSYNFVPFIIHLVSYELKCPSESWQNLNPSFFSPDTIRVVSVFACAGKLGRTLVYDLAVALFKLSCSQALERVVGIG